MRKEKHETKQGKRDKNTDRGRGKEGIQNKNRPEFLKE